MPQMDDGTWVMLASRKKKDGTSVERTESYLKGKPNLMLGRFLIFTSLLCLGFSETMDVSEFPHY